MYVVKIIRHSDDGLEEAIECKGMNERQAEQVQRGVNINLNHDDYYTQLDWDTTKNKS